MVGLMFIASQLYFQVELAFNDIFATRLNRSWMKRFVLFNLSIVIGPLFIALGIVISSILPAGATTFGFIVPWLMTSMALVIAIKYLPNTPIHWRSALLGGLLSAAMFEGAKHGFGLYMDFVGTRDSLTRLYGSLAFLPVFLIWLNVLWLVVLLGVEVAYLMEKGNHLLDVQRERAADPHASRRRPDGLFAVGILIAVYQSTSSEPASSAVIADTAGVPVHHTRATLEVLQDAGIVTREGPGQWRPVNPPQTLTVGDVLRAWQGIAVPRWNGSAPGGQVVSQLQLKLEVTAAQTIHDLVEGMDG
jgi:membrane protein